MTDWNDDPEMKEIRDEFIQSFQNRKDLMLSEIRTLSSEKKVGSEEVFPIFNIVHKLSGTAESYGFPTLTILSAAIENYLTPFIEKDLGETEIFEFDKLKAMAKIYDEAIELAQSGEDPVEIKDHKDWSLIESYKNDYDRLFTF